MTTRTKLLIFDSVIALICVAVLASFFVMPFFGVKASIKMTSEDIAELVSDSMSGDDSEGVSSMLSLEKAEWEKIVGSDGFELDFFSVQLVTSTTLSSLWADSEEIVRDFVDINVEKTLDTLIPVFERIIKNAIPVASKKLLDEAITGRLGDAALVKGEELKQAISDAGVTDEYIEKKIDMIIEAISDETATVDSLADTFIDTVSEVFDMVRENGGEKFKDVALTDDNKSEIRGQVADVLARLTDDSGMISIDNLIDVLISRGLDALEGNENTAEGDENTTEDNREVVIVAEKRRIAAHSATVKKQVGESMLKERLGKFIRDAIDDELVYIFAFAMRVMACFILLTLLVWVYVLVKTVIKMTTKKPAVKLIMPVCLGWIPYVLLSVLPTAAAMFLVKQTGISHGSGISEQLSKVDISFTTCTFTAFIASIALFVISFFNRTLRKRAELEEKMPKCEEIH